MLIDVTDIKEILSIIAITLTFAGYIPYIKDIFRGKTKPHIYSWFLWTFVGTVVFSIQYSGGGGLGTFVTLAAVSMCAVVFLISLFKNGVLHVTKIDTLFLILTILAVGIWFFAKQPVISIILLTLIDLMCFAPTIRKSWFKPHTETTLFYAINTFRFFLAAIALQKYSILTAMYPIVWMIVNGLFAVMLESRRKTLGEVKATK